MKLPDGKTYRKRLHRREVARQARALNFGSFKNQAFLRSDRACHWLATAVTRALAKHDVDLWAYCFMPTHAHLLLYPRADVPDISAFLESVKKSVTRQSLTWVRQHAPGFLDRMRDEQPNGRSSHRFWQRGGGYDRNLVSERAIRNMIDYIHANPVRDGLCKRITDWRWSSAAYHHDRTQGPIPINLEMLR